MSYDFTQFNVKLTEAEEWLTKEFSSIRTGQASPALLDGIKVDSYGSMVPVSQVGNVAVEDAKTIRIAPWDTTMIQPIENAIVSADLGVSVVVDDKGVRVIFPELTTDRRAELVKLAKDKLEQGRIRVRTARDDLQKFMKTEDIPEDDLKRAKDEMQKLVDETNKKLDTLFEKKSQEMQG